jgi:hypothetical protein
VKNALKSLTKLLILRNFRVCELYTKNAVKKEKACTSYSCSPTELMFQRQLFLAQLPPTLSDVLTGILLFYPKG